MFATNQNTKTNRTTGLGAMARKLLLGLGGLAVAGVMMGTSPAMARDRDDFRGHEVVRHEVVENRVWVPDRYELRTRFDHGCAINEHVLVQAGHWDIR